MTIGEIGKKLRRARKAADLSQGEVAAKLGLTTEGYGHMERGTRSIGLEYLLRLPAILGVRITDLLPDSVVTDYDRARAADPDLDRIIRVWADLADFERRVLMTSVEAFERGKARR